MSYGPFVLTVAREEKEWIGFNFAAQLASDETISSVSVSWSPSNLQSGSAVISGTRVYVAKGANSGTPGETYYVKFVITTSAGRNLGGEKLGEIQLEIAQRE